MGKKRFALFGMAGYVAPKHMEAIKKTGGDLIAGCDPHSSVGIVDSYFPNCEFFTNEFLFARFLRDNRPDYLVVCTPNYLHKSHCMLGLSLHSTIICEKPLVIYPSELYELKDMELRTGSKIYTILQLRLNPVLQGLKCEIEQNSNYYEVEVSYVTPRGPWYLKSWKGNPEKSGSLSTNIGIHLFDILLQLLGPVEDIKLHTKSATEVSGELFQERGHTTFHLSISGVKPERTLKIGNREIEFSRGFTDAHTQSYEKILKGDGFGLVETIPSIILCDQIRNLQVVK